MKDDIINYILEPFEITVDSDFEFRTLYGFTFVFKRNLVYMKDKISSAEIKPAGIIYEENGEYYFAPLDEVGDIKAIINEFMKKYSA
jgi:hypothetical protein